MQPDLPFYRCILEDDIAFCWQSSGKLNAEGIVQPPTDLDRFDKNLRKLDGSSVQQLQALFKQSIVLEGRCKSIPLEVEISMQEIAIAIHQAAQQVFHQYGEMIFDGGALWNIIKPTVYRILECWWSDLPSTRSIVELVTPLFRSILENGVPNDYDWQFILSQQTMDENKEIIQRGLVDPLAAKFKKRSINPHLLELELAKCKRRSVKKPNAYMSQVFREHPSFAVSQTNLHQIFIKAFGFSKAADVEDKERQLYFSLRNVSGSKLSYDCLFPIKVRHAITPINSLFINVTPLAKEQQEQEIFLESFIHTKQGMIPILQAISDRNLAIFTFDESAPADSKAFAWTLSFFTLGGRCYQKGWFEKIETALLEEVKRQQIPISKIVAHQLIERVVSHHGNQPAILVALTFNASALLLWRHVCDKQEIQKLWQLIFNYIDSIEDIFPHLSSHPLIEHFQIFLRDAASQFEDLYAQVQVSSAIEQHGVSPIQNHSLCEPTQTCGFLFTQMKLTIPSKSQERKSNFCTLFFPYDLAWASQHLGQMPRINLSLESIHEILMGNKEPSFALEQSRLKNYVIDPRRDFSNCVKETSHLLDNGQKHIWFMGYLLALSLLAQKKDQELFKRVARNLFAKLLDPHLSIQFKQDILNIFQQTLQQSRITFNLGTPNGLIDLKSNEEIISFYISLILACMTSQENALIDLALEYLDRMDDAISPSARIQLYNRLLKESVSLPVPLNLRPLQDLIVTIARDEAIEVEQKINWLLALYEMPRVVALPELEEELFESLLKTMAVLEEPSEKFLSYHQRASKIVLQVLQNKKRIQQPFKGLNFAREIYRLQILQEGELLQLFWQQTLSLTPTDPKQASIYQENCLMIAQQFGYWDKLDPTQIESFKQAFVQTIENSFDESTERENARMIMKLNSTFQPGEQKGQMQQLVHTFLKDRLKEWQVNGIPLADREIVFVLIEQLATSDASDAKELFCATLVEISKLDFKSEHVHEIRRIIGKFLRHHAKQPASILMALLFGITRTMQERATTSSLAPSIYSFALEMALVLLIHPIKSQELQNEDYAQFSKYLLGNNIPCNPAEHLVNFLNKHFNKLQECLYQRQLWKEGLELYDGFPKFVHPHSLESVKFFVRAFQRSFQQDNQSSVLFKSLENILKTLPLTLISDHQLRLDIRNLYIHLFQVNLVCQDYPNAQQWLEKELLKEEWLDESSYNRAFELLSEMASHGHIQGVYSLILHLQTPKGYEPLWIKIFQLFLNHKQLSTCLFLIQNKGPLMGMKEESYKSLWTSIAQDLLKQVYALSQEDQSKRQLLQLQTVLHELIWHCLPTDEKVWTMYIDLFTRAAPITSVESLLKHSLMHNVLANFLKDTTQVKCWKKLIKRLSLEGSSYLLHVNKWWQKAWKAFALAQEKDKQHFLTHFVHGAAKALKKQHKFSSETRRKLAADIIAILNKEEMINYLRADAMAMINLAKIYIATEDLSNLHSAIYAIVETFTMIESDPITEAQAVQVTNACLTRMIHHRDPKSITAMSALIQFVQQSGHCQDADQLNILKYWHAIEDRESTREIQIAKSARDSFAIKKAYVNHIQKLHLEEKRSALAKIIENPWKNHQHVSEDEKMLVRKTIRQLYDARYYTFFVHFLQDHFNHANFRFYMTPELLQTIRPILKMPRMSWLREKTARIEKALNKLKRAEERYAVQKKFHREANFQYLNEELEIFENCASCCKTFLLTVAGVATFALVSFNLFVTSSADG